MGSACLSSDFHEADRDAYVFRWYTAALAFVDLGAAGLWVRSSESFGVRSSIASINKLFHRDPITTYRLLKHAIIALRPTSTDFGLGSTWG